MQSESCKYNCYTVSATSLTALLPKLGCHMLWEGGAASLFLLKISLTKGMVYSDCKLRAKAEMRC